MLKEDVLKSYKEKKTAVIKAFPTLKENWTYFSGIEEAIDEYYKNVYEVSKSFTSIIRGMYTYSSKIDMKCENDDALGISYPKSVLDNYSDFESYWYVWRWLEKDLTDKVLYQTGLAANGEMIKIVEDSQPYFEKIIEEIKDARKNEQALLDVVAERLWTSVDNIDLICLTEDRGKPVAMFDKEDIVQKIYIDYKALEQIKENGLNVYVPTYLR